MPHDKLSASPHKLVKILAENSGYSTTTSLVLDAQSGAHQIIKNIKATEQQAAQVEREIACLRDQALLIASTKAPYHGIRGSGFHKATLRTEFVIRILYIEAIPLNVFCQLNHLDINQWGSLFYLITEALLDLHNKNWVHRDLKPDNIVIGRAGVKLVDFGHAVKANELTDADSIGSYKFAAPELLEQGRSLSKTIDHYALAIMMLHLMNCVDLLQYSGPHLDFDEEIPGKLQKYNFNEAQHLGLLRILESLTQNEASQRMALADVLSELKALFDSPQEHRWLEKETLNITPPHSYTPSDGDHYDDEPVKKWAL